ncbi:MAG: hypothetical protein J0L82_19550, partial [Deltaproteobacteria bacterium]|nr:hypothetical protein [Deltaproteobacteria bacterium]
WVRTLQKIRDRKNGGDGRTRNDLSRKPLERGRVVNAILNYRKLTYDEALTKSSQGLNLNAEHAKSPYKPDVD